MLPTWTWIVGGIAAAGAFVAGVQVGEQTGERAQAAEVKRLHTAATKVIDGKLAEIGVLTAERGQCRAEVERVNAAATEQTARLQGLLARDQAARARAVDQMEQAAREAAEQVQLFTARAEEARNAIKTVSDACSSAGVPPAVVSLLDGLLTPVSHP